MKRIKTVLMLAGAVLGMGAFSLAVAATLEDEPARTPPPVNGTAMTPRPIANFNKVTDAMLRNPSPSDWLMYRGNYEGWGHSKLNQINKSNVGKLQLVWSRAMEPGINQGTPLIHDGVMFLPNPNDVIQAIDATTGDLLWQHTRKTPTADQMRNWGQRKRTVFLYDDKLYFMSRDNSVVALDAKTGKELWEVSRGGGGLASDSSGPIVVNGVLIAGSTCQQAGFGCYVTGHDAQTGKELWRNHFIPKPGEPGDETWGHVPMESRWITGAWGPITYDPESNLAFYGSTGIGPASEAQRNQRGMTLAGTNTRYAVDPATGKIAWSHQVLPRDNWDQECTFEMLAITTPVHPDAKAEGMLAVGKDAASGKRKTLTGAPCKTGLMWSFDLTTGKFLWAKSTVFQNMIDHIDIAGKVTVNEELVLSDVNKTYHQCPTYSGGRNWPYSAYSPARNVIYVQLQNMCSNIHARADRVPQPGMLYNTQGDFVLSDGKKDLGRIDAISVETGKTVWSWENRTSNYSPILTTAGDILFNGGHDRYLRAHDLANGKVLWQARLGSQAHGATVTYQAGGRQYIAIVAGGGWNPGPHLITPDSDQISGGNMVYVFALPR